MAAPIPGVIVSLTTNSITIRLKGGNNQTIKGKAYKRLFSVGEKIWVIYDKPNKEISWISNDPGFPTEPPKVADETHPIEEPFGFFSQWGEGWWDVEETTIIK